MPHARFLSRLLRSLVPLACGTLGFALLAAQDRGPAVRGDVDMDGAVTATDALAVLSATVGRELPAGYRLAPNGDADGNGEISAMDALLILAYSVGRDVSAYPVGRPLASLSVQPESTTVQVGATARLRARLTGMSDTTVTWRSSRPEVASVEADGTVTGLQVDAGPVLVTAVAKGDTTLRAVARVWVLAPPEEPEEPEEPSARLRIDPDSATLGVGEAVTATATLTDEEGRPLSRTVVWSTDDAAIATVTAEGVVRAVSEGTTQVRGASGEAADSVRVRVVAGAETMGADGGVVGARGDSLQLDFPAGALPAGTRVTIRAATGFPANGRLLPGAAVDLSPDGARFATPVVLRLRYDPAVLPAGVAESALGIYKAVDDLWVLVPGSSVDVGQRLVSAPLTGFSTYGAGGSSTVTAVTASADTLVIASGSTRQLSASVTESPTNVRSGHTVSWHSSDETRATVSATGLVTALAAGTARVVASSGGREDTVGVTVLAGGAAALGLATAPSPDARAGVPLAVQPAVRLVDGAGNDVAQAGVRVAVSLVGSGTLTGGVTAETDAGGRASFSGLALVAPTGSYRLAFSAPGMRPDSSAAIALAAGPALSIASDGGIDATPGAASTQSPRVRIADLAGNPVAGHVVVWTVMDGGGRVNGSTTAATPTDANGLATVTWTLGTGAGAQSLTAAATVLPDGAAGEPLGGSPVAFSNTTLAGAAARIAIVTEPASAAVVGALLGEQPVVRLHDAFGNPVAQGGVAVTVSIETGGGSLGGSTTASTDADGRAVFTDLSLSGTTGVRTLRFASGSLTPATSRAITLVAGSAAVIEAAAGAGQTGVAAGAEVPVAPAARVTDSAGNGVAGFPVTFRVTGGDGALDGGGATETVQTDASGLATTSGWTLGPVVGANTLEASAPALPPISFSTTSVAGPPARIGLLQQPSDTAPAGIVLARQPRFQLQDRFGNAASGAGTPVFVRIASGGGTLLGGDPVSTDADGGGSPAALAIAGLAGPRTLRFTAGLTDVNGDSIVGVTEAIEIVPGTPVALVRASADPQTAAAGASPAEPPAVQVVDAYTNGVPGISVTFAVGDPADGSRMGGGATSQTVASDVGGIARVSAWTLGTAMGAYELQAQATGLPAVTFTATATAGEAARLAIDTEPSDSARAGVALATQPAVRLRDALGNEVAEAGVPVAAELVGTGALTGTLTVNTGADGRAVFSDLGIAALAGTYSIRFTSGSLQAATSRSIEVVSGPADTLAAVGAFNSSPGAGSTETLRVRVTDAGGNPIPGHTVVWSPAGGGRVNGAAGAASTVTGADGTVSVTWLVGAAVGPQSVSVAANANANFGGSPLRGSPLSFSAVAAAGPVFADSSRVTIDRTSLVADGSSVATVTVRLRDVRGNEWTRSGGTVQLVKNGGGALSEVTDHGDGSYTARLTAPTATGTATIDAVVNGTPLSASRRLTVSYEAGEVASFVFLAPGTPPVALAGAQVAGTPFQLRIEARDAHGNVSTGFGGAVSLTSSAALATGGGTTDSFAAGVLASHTVSFGSGGAAVTLTATGPGGAGTGSVTLDVEAAPTAAEDRAGSDASAPGDAFHAFLSTAQQPMTFTLPAPGLLSNDVRGFPAATITSFGADSLGGNVIRYPAGSTVSPLPGTARTTGSIRVDADGTVVFTPPDDFTGIYVFRYRLSNARGTSDGTVRISVGRRPVANDDVYPVVLAAGESHASSGFSITANDAADGAQISIGALSNGVVTRLGADGSFSFTPTAGYSGPASFGYRVTNGLGTSPLATVHLTVDVGPSVSSVTSSPAAGTLGSRGSAITVVFSEPVEVDSSSFALTCPAAGAAQPLSLTANSATSYTLAPTGLLPLGACRFRVIASGVADADANDGPDLLAADHLSDYAVVHVPGPVASFQLRRAGGGALGVLYLDVDADLEITALDEDGATATGFTGSVQLTSTAFGATHFPPAFTAGVLPSLTIHPDRGAGAATLTVATTTSPTVRSTVEVRVEAAPQLAGGQVVTPSLTPVFEGFFSEPVTVDDGWISLSCPIVGTPTLTLTPGAGLRLTFTSGSEFTLEVLTPLPADTPCGITISRTRVHDQDSDDDAGFDNPLEDQTVGWRTPAS